MSTVNIKLKNWNDQEVSYSYISKIKVPLADGSGDATFQTPPDLQEKTVSITENGTLDVIPDRDKDALSKVTIETNIPSSVRGFPNGTEWTLSNLTVAISKVQNANGLWVAASKKNGLYYSTDGKTWVQSNITSFNVDPGAIIELNYADGLWVASNPSSLYYSTDGKTWIEKAPQSISFGPFESANGLWVIGSSSNGLFYSFDYTTNFTIIKSNINSSTCMPFINAHGLWVAGSTSNGLYYSTDGKTWTQSNITSGYFTSAGYNNGLWIACGAMDVGVYYSTNGKTWTQSNLTSGSSKYPINFNGLWVVGNSEGIYYSTDGKTWTQSNLDLNVLELSSGNGILVSSTISNGLYYSTDGKTWTQSNVTDKIGSTIRNANGLWVAGSNNGIYYSVSWEPS